MTFGYDWDAQSVHLRGLNGSIGGGTLGMDLTVCCSSAAVADKQLSGRLTLGGVTIDAVAPAAIGAVLDGKLDATAEFNGTGETVAQAVAALTGTGSYTVSGFSVDHFNPALFTTLGALTGVINMPDEDVAKAATDALANGPFGAATLTGGFTIAGGTLRSPNLAIIGPGARIFGGATLALKDLVLDAHYAMSPTDKPDDKSAIDSTTAEIDALLKGPLWAPKARYDVASLVEGM